MNEAQNNELAEMYKKKYILALREIEDLKRKLKYYSDQGWELDNLRQEHYDRRSYDGWK